MTILHTLSYAFVLPIITLLNPTNGDYTLQMRMKRYDNPHGLDFDNQCCDPLCISPCDTYFLFCLRSFGRPYNDLICSHHKTTQSNPIEINPINSPDTGPLYANSPVNNPITFYISGSYSGSFQIAVRVEDYDFDADDLIDVILFNEVIAPGDDWVYRNIKGFYEVATLSAYFRIFCNTNFYGSDCDTYCVATDDNNQGHYTCDSNGQKVCLDGWKNRIGEQLCLTPICRSSCHSVGGYCNLPGQCLCRQGWKGTNCDQCIPSSTCSSTHGSCTLPGQCNCDTGYGGPDCDQDLDVCGHQQPCQNGATCTSTGPDQHSCSCAPGYTGTNCETEVNECGPMPCFNGATCVDQVNNYHCQCASGWTGKNCEININECSPNPCENGANCSDIVNGYTCQCTPGWSGENCTEDINECNVNPCQNDGNCTDIINGYTCQCTLGWSGKNCTENINECDPNPCQNGGNCKDIINGYTCECAPGWSGENCAENINECDPNPCQNSANCIDHINGYMCLCTPDWTGPQCRQSLNNECDINPCPIGFVCSNINEGYQCQCIGDNDCQFIYQCTPDHCPNDNSCCVNQEENEYNFLCINSVNCNGTRPVVSNELPIAITLGIIGGAVLLVILTLVVVLSAIYCKRIATEPNDVYVEFDKPSTFNENPAYLSLSTLVESGKGQLRSKGYDSLTETITPTGQH